MVAVKDNFVDKIYFSNYINTNINNCYFVVKNTSTTYKASLLFNSSFIKNGINFYDSQLADGQITDQSGGSGELLALTTAQCKDAEYLERNDVCNWPTSCVSGSIAHFISMMFEVFKRTITWSKALAIFLMLLLSLSVSR